MNAGIVIQKLKAIGYQVQTDGHDILLKADRDPDPDVVVLLLSELKRCKAEAVTLLQRDKGTRRAEWPGEMRVLVDKFMVSPLPEAPFMLNGHTRVVDAKLFYAALRRDIEAGPDGPRSRTGALQYDLGNIVTLH